jgi:hypothetical protein
MDVANKVFVVRVQYSVYARRRCFVTVNTNSYDSLFHSILVLTSEAGKCDGTDVYFIKPERCVNRGER